MREGNPPGAGKKVLLTLAAAFLLYQTVRLTPQLPRVADAEWGLTLFLGWFYALCVTGVFAFAGFAYPTQELLPDGYYRVREPARLRKWYRWLGGAWFRRVLLATLWRGKEQSGRYFNGRRDDLRHLSVQTEKSEFGHLLPLVILTGVAVWLLLRGAVRLAVVMQVVNVAGNFYPILLQRYHRQRLDRIGRLAGR